MLDSLTASDRQFGGAHALAYAMDYLRTIVMPRLDAHADDRVLQDLYAVTVEFKLRAASMQMDAGHARESRRLLGAAFPIAQETGAPIVSAWVWGVRRAVDTGRQHRSGTRLHCGCCGDGYAVSPGRGRSSSSRMRLRYP